ARTLKRPTEPGVTRNASRTGQAEPAAGLSVMLPEPLAAARSTTSVFRFQYCGYALAAPEPPDPTEAPAPAPALMSSSCTVSAGGGGGWCPGQCTAGPCMAG